MARLADGSVIPSILGVQSQGYRQDSGTQTNLALRFGEVVDIVYPTDKRNSNGIVIEYVVDVQHQDGTGAGSKVTYNSIQLSNLFGGIADILKFTLRPAPKSNSPQPGQLGMGSKVLVLCINGDKHQAMILGGLRDNANDQTQDQSSDGHNLFFEFNGIQAAINDDGELTVTYNGKTTIDGSLDSNANSSAQGSTIVMSKDGSITTTSPDGKQIIKVNHDDHKVEITADQEMTVDCNGQVNIQSTGVIVGGATDQWPLFSTYRENETQMNTQVSAANETLGGLMTTAGTALTTAGALNLLPMVGGILAAPFFATAGATLISCTSAFEEIGSAIDEFEADAIDYLSKKNQND